MCGKMVALVRIETGGLANLMMVQEVKNVETFMLMGSGTIYPAIVINIVTTVV